MGRYLPCTMRKLTIAALLLALGASSPLLAQQGDEARDLLNDVKFLASDALQGRKIGTPGADTAAAYLARRFQAAGLQPAPGGWMQRFTVDPTAPAAQHSGIGGAHDLLVLFLGLELLVLPGYMLVAYAKRDGLATEGAIKYFLLGSFS